jgi:hypothetical protein
VQAAKAAPVAPKP